MLPVQPAWVAFDRKVLRFNCFFKEAVNESRLENFRIRNCVLYYYLEDDSMHVSEPKIENSGIPQVRGARATRSCRPGRPTAALLWGSAERRRRADGGWRVAGRDAHGRRFDVEAEALALSRRGRTAAPMGWAATWAAQTSISQPCLQPRRQRVHGLSPCAPALAMPLQPRLRGQDERGRAWTPLGAA